MSAHNGSFPIYKLFAIVLLFVMAWDARGAESSRQQADLIGLAVRSDAGTYLLKDEAMPLANVPVNFFALFQDNVQREVQMHLNGPISYSNRSVAEPYGLFEDIALETLPAGAYELRINIVNNRGVIEQAHVLNFTLSDNADTTLAESIVDVADIVAMEFVR